MPKRVEEMGSLRFLKIQELRILIVIWKLSF